MRLDRLVAERIHSDARLAHVPRPIIDAVCIVFLDELSHSTFAHANVYELSGEVCSCCECGQILPVGDAIPIPGGQWICAPCSSRETVIDASPHALEQPTTAQQ